MYLHCKELVISKTQKNRNEKRNEGGPGPKRKRFSNRLVVRRIGGYANSIYSQYFLCDIR